MIPFEPKEGRDLIIGVMGRKQAGKDSAAAPLVRLGYTHLNFADRVRDTALAIDPLVVWEAFSPEPVRLSLLVAKRGWHAAKQAPEVRRLLQRIGTEGGRDIHGEHVWVDLWKLRVEALPRPARVISTDVRFPNEADAIRSLGGIIVRIDRPGLPDDDCHASERAMAAIAPDATLVNDRDAVDLQAEFVHVVGELQRERGQRWMPGLSGAELLRLRGDLPAGRVA